MANKASNHFALQRFTAALQVPLVIWLVISVLRHAGDSHAAFMAWVAEPLTAILMVLFVISISVHMNLGMGEVIDDYIHKPGGRRSLSLLNAIVALLVGAISVFSVIVISLIV